MATTATLIERAELYIGGEWTAPSGDGTIDVVNASTEEVMGRIPEGTPADVDRAVAAARAAFDGWSAGPGRGPRRAVRRRRRAPAGPRARRSPR